MHGRLDLDHVRQTVPLYPGVPLVSISNHQRSGLEGLDVNWVETVYNGLDLDRYHVARRDDAGYLAFVGRIHPEKGPELAVEIANRTSRRLHVAAKVDPLDVDYYDHVVEPLFTAGDVQFCGELNEHDKPAFYAHASATLFPSDWPEPFGLVMIESMAAGTPVIALRRGAVPEIVVDGVTGFVCDDLDEMVDAVDRLGDIDPDECRRHAASFDTVSMCSAYERVYQSIVTDHADELVGGNA